MEVTVEMGEPGIESASNLPDSAVNPAAAVARHEYSRALSDPSHPHHEGLKRNSKEANDYFNGLYAKAYPATTPPVDRDQGVTVSGRDESVSREDSVAHGEIDTMLRHTLGPDYDVEMRDMRLGGGYLFGTQETQALFEKLSPLITDLGPRAEVLGIRFLADLGRLAKQQGGRT